MQHQRADGVGVLVEETVEIRLRKSFSGGEDSIHLAHPRELRDEGSDLWGVSRQRPEHVGTCGVSVGGVGKRLAESDRKGGGAGANELSTRGVRSGGENFAYVHETLSP